ncbi:MAG: PQQ-binding-like beta-propeller repeat protein, partial [candidate division WOR-3 bacterium]
MKRFLTVFFIALIFSAILVSGCKKNRPPNTPGIPSGPSTGRKDSLYGFSTITTDPDNDGICYRFAWGDGDTSEWSAWMPSNTPYLTTHSWAGAGTYSVKAQAKDANEITSSWSNGHQIIISQISPNIPATPSGPSNGSINIPYNFSSSTTHPDGDSISIRFDWGDGNISNWSSFVPSGQTVTMSHSWSSAGVYYVKAQAKDKDGATSAWSNSHQIRIINPNAPPCRPTIIGPPFGQPNIRYTFKTIVWDFEGDSVAVKFFWGNGRTPTWTRFYASGDTIQDTITYTTEDTFTIKVVAKDKLGNISDTSDVFQFVVNAGVWSYITNEKFISSPALITNSQNRVTHIIIGCTDGFVYCLDSLGTLKWRYPEIAHWTGASFYSSPCIGPDGTVYIGDEEGKLHAINSTNGTAKWTPFVASADFNSSPAINATGDRIYIGCLNGTLYAVNTADGSLAWAYLALASITASPAIASDGAIIFGDEGDSGRIYILNPNGTVRHIFITPAPIVSSPAISGSKIYFAAGDTLFYALDTNGVSYTTYLLAAE